MKKIIELLKEYKEIIMYLIFGVATTLVNFVVYSVFVDILKADMTVSNAIAWMVAVSFAFVTNKLYVFNSKKRGLLPVLKEVVSFVGSRIISAS